MRFHWKYTLRRMTGAETRCPVCGVDGLVIWERNERDVLPDLRGIPYCECPRCGARGEFPELVAQATAKGTEETVRTLKRLGELDAVEKDLETYVSRKSAQAEVDAHLAVCTERLRQAPHLGNVRAGLSSSSLRQLPPDTGLHVRENAPRQFAVLDTPRYRRTNMTLYRYRFDGETSCIDVQNPKTLQREHRIRVTGDCGVYLGDYRFGEVPTVLLATHDPRIAAQAYGAWRAETTLPSPVVGVAGFPLPRRFEAVRTLYLLNAPDSPLPLEVAVRALMGPVVYGCDDGPDIRVVTPRAASSKITAEDLRRLPKAREYKPLRVWLQETLIAMSDRREEIANALLQAGASESVRLELVGLVGPMAPQALVETLSLPTRDPDDVLQLASGRLVKVTPVGIWNARRNRKTGEVETTTALANVGITVDSRVADGGSEVAVCTVTHPDSDVPSVAVRIPKSHWSNPDDMADDIRSAWAETGRTPYVAMYRSACCSWADVMQLLGSRCPVQTGIRALGATPDGAVNFPAIAAANGRTSVQTKAGLVPDFVQAAWSAVGRDAGVTPEEAMETVRSLLGAEASLERTGLAAGYAHALYCAAGVMFDRSGVRRPPAHLVFVETEPGIWDSVLRTLAYLFSGSEYVPLMDYGNRSGFLRRWSALGTLPLVTRLPSAEDLAKDVCASPVPLIAVADPLTSLGLSGHGVTSFVLPNVEASECDPVSPDEISALRSAFAAIAAARAGTGWMDLSHGSPRASSTAALSVIVSLSGSQEPGTVAAAAMRSVKGRYPGVGLTGATTFLAVLHREVTAKAHGDHENLHVTIVNGVPACTLEASFNERGEHVFLCPDYVLVSRSVVGLINRERTFLFDAEQLSREFSENGILADGVPESLGIDPRRVWAFPRAVWESEVVRASGFNTKEG